MDDLEAFEAEMSEQRHLAGARLRASAGWLQLADRDLSELDRPTWGGVVEDWHRARAAVGDSLEACAAYEEFPPLD